MALEICTRCQLPEAARYVYVCSAYTTHYSSGISEQSTLAVQKSAELRVHARALEGLHDRQLAVALLERDGHKITNLWTNYGKQLDDKWLGAQGSGSTAQKIPCGRRTGRICKCQRRRHSGRRRQGMGKATSPQYEIALYKQSFRHWKILTFSYCGSRNIHQEVRLPTHIKVCCVDLESPKPQPAQACSARPNCRRADWGPLLLEGVEVQRDVTDDLRYVVVVVSRCQRRPRRELSP